MTDNFVEETNPNILFERWFSDAHSSEINDPNAMALSSVDFYRIAKYSHGVVERT